MKGKKKAAAILLALAVVAAGLLAVWIWNSQPVMCRIAQYEDTTGLQGMFYTMETDQGLIVIDGGNAGNADYVRAGVEEKGLLLIRIIIFVWRPSMKMVYLYVRKLNM